MRFIDLTGQRFGKLTVIKRSENKEYQNCRQTHVQFLCQCDCGNKVVVTSNNLRTGHTQSCGCEKIQLVVNRSKKHGMTNTRLYGVWNTMRQRCLNPNNHKYKNYGGRGIKVCDEWLHDFMAFYDWSMDNGYKPGLTIDRINNDGNYEPNNCRWTTMKVQNNNRRKRKSRKDLESAC